MGHVVRSDDHQRHQPVEHVLRPNHPPLFYWQSVPPVLGILLIVIAVVGLIFLWRERSWRETLLLSWILVPVVFFQIWPVKGFQYLLPIAPAVALLAGRLVGKLLARSQDNQASRRTINYLAVPPVLSWAVVAVLAVSLGQASWQRIQPETSSLFLAGTGGIPGGREAAHRESCLPDKPDIPSPGRMPLPGFARLHR